MGRLSAPGEVGVHPSFLTTFMNFSVVGTLCSSEPHQGGTWSPQPPTCSPEGRSLRRAGHTAGRMGGGEAMAEVLRSGLLQEPSLSQAHAGMVGWARKQRVPGQGQ